MSLEFAFLSFQKKERIIQRIRVLYIEMSEGTKVFIVFILISLHWKCIVELKWNELPKKKKEKRNRIKQKITSFFFLISISFCKDSMFFIPLLFIWMEIRTYTGFLQMNHHQGYPFTWRIHVVLICHVVVFLFCFVVVVVVWRRWCVQ